MEVFVKFAEYIFPGHINFQNASMADKIALDKLTSEKNIEQSTKSKTEAGKVAAQD